MATPLCRQLAASLLLCSISLAAQAEESAPPTFDIWEFSVGGNTRLDVQTVERAVYPFLGPGKQFKDVEAARAALEQVYRDAGYATAAVDIPEQAVNGGVIELRVIEGRIERVRVTGAKHYSQGRILAQVPALTEGEVPDFNALKKQLADVNQSADLRVQPLLRPGRAPGTTEVELKVEDEYPLHGSLEFNNRYGTSRAPDPGDYRASVSLHYDNLWQRAHSVGLSFLTSPTNTSEVEVWSANYSMPLSSPREVLAMYAVHSNSNSDLTTTLAGTNVLGKGDIVGLRLVEPIKGVLGITHSGTLGIDYKHLNETLTLEGAGSLPTPLTYWLFSANYNGSVSDAFGDTSFGTGVSFSVRGARNNEEQFSQKRFEGRGNFAVLRWDLQRVNKLPGKFALTARADGQFASLQLPSSEQYSAGGSESVRGYPEAAQVGDHGVRGMLEVRSPSLFGESDKSSVDVRALAFLEGAHVRLLNIRLLNGTPRYTLASTGLGLRFASKWGLSASLDYAWRLKDGQTSDTHGSVEKGGGRLHFSTSWQF